jgi:hypothetical protein
LKANEWADFEFSSTKRIVCFEIKSCSGPIDESSKLTVTIDGVGRLSHPIQLRARRKALSSLDVHEQEVVRQTSSTKLKNTSNNDVEVVLLDNDATFGQDIEQWAIEYTSKFVHAAGPEFFSTTMAQILGTAYVKKGLPEVRSGKKKGSWEFSLTYV